MKARANYVLVGLFVLLLGVALIAAILWLTTGGPPKDYDFYIVYSTESVSGLNIDAPVKYKGVEYTESSSLPRRFGASARLMLPLMSFVPIINVMMLGL